MSDEATPRETSEVDEELHKDLDAGEEAENVVGGLRRRTPGSAVVGDPDDGSEFIRV